MRSPLNKFIEKTGHRIRVSLWATTENDLINWCGEIMCAVRWTGAKIRRCSKQNTDRVSQGRPNKLSLTKLTLSEERSSLHTTFIDH